jgi:hypothetical protein
MNSDRVETAVLCEADKCTRTITFHVREGFGDGTDGNGLAIPDPEWERKAAARIFEQAIDVVIGKQPSSGLIEKWVRLKNFRPWWKGHQDE